MNILRALYDAWLLFFWSVVVWSGGSGHHSYGYALFERWGARQRLNHFLDGGDMKNDWREEEEDEWMRIWAAITGVAIAWTLVACLIMLIDAL
jgi:hypothetical protein